MAPSSLGSTSTKKKKALVAEKKDPIVGMKINKLYSIGSFLGEGAFGKVYTVKNNQNQNESEWAVKIVPHSSIVVKTKKSKASTPSDRLHYEHLMYSQQLRRLCGTFLPNLPTHILHKLHCFYPTICNENATGNNNSGELRLLNVTALYATSYITHCTTCDAPFFSFFRISLLPN